MKKSPSKVLPRKLVLHREVIVSLTPPRLERVAGGAAAGDVPVCTQLEPTSCRPPTRRGHDDLIPG
jgi:hypothetical protein